jgi:hypothetical protein
VARRSLTPYLLLGLGGAIALAYTQRKTIMIYGRKAIDQAYEAIWIQMLPSYAQGYGPIILRVSREESIDPNLIYGLGDRETQWGTSRYLDVKGPGGRGDGGHGYGLMQIDDRSWGAWLAANDWRDPYTNVKKGARILKGKLAFFAGKSTVSGLTDGSRVYLGDASARARRVSPGNYPDPRPLSGAKLWEAAIAAYNTGEGNVLRSIAVGKSPEFTTAGGDYLTDVSKRASTIAAAYDRATV